MGEKGERGEGEGEGEGGGENKCVSEGKEGAREGKV